MLKITSVKDANNDVLVDGATTSTPFVSISGAAPRNTKWVGVYSEGKTRMAVAPVSASGDWETCFRLADIGEYRLTVGNAGAGDRIPSAKAWTLTAAYADESDLGFFTICDFTTGQVIPDGGKLSDRSRLLRLTGQHMRSPMQYVSIRSAVEWTDVPEQIEHRDFAMSGPHRTWETFHVPGRWRQDGKISFWIADGRAENTASAPAWSEPYVIYFDGVRKT
ncbi:hypothetical protein [Burkholderia ubonensis]|uniref:hypothetical protein n=1 Tax=Burkholderia ubonensis TaxID=101571 RepID=UPI0007539D34|nr:hypothetical protein [Burkholderia ubonensis]KVZ49444.1 hypothetical protein WL19_15640 [Burkholderia ubonensis]